MYSVVLAASLMVGMDVPEQRFRANGCVGSQVYAAAPVARVANGCTGFARPVGVYMAPAGCAGGFGAAAVVGAGCDGFAGRRGILAHRSERVAARHAARANGVASVGWMAQSAQPVALVAAPIAVVQAPVAARAPVVIAPPQNTVPTITCVPVQKRVYATPARTFLFSPNCPSGRCPR